MIVVGTVKENWKKEQPGWMKVEYAVGENGKCLSDWMPGMTGYAGDGFGSFHLPEIGSQVVVGFLHDDEEQPFVLGCLMGQQNNMADGVPGEDNERKVFRTKTGYQVEVDEKEETFSMTDPKGENTLVLKGKDGKLTLNIKSGIEIIVDGEPLVKLEKEKVSVRDKIVVTDDLEVKTNSVTVEADGELKMKGKNLSLEGTSVKAEGNQMELKGKQMELKATQWKAEGTTMELKAGASGKLEASGILEVKGAMVKLN